MRGEQGLGPLRVGATLTIGNYLLPLIIVGFPPVPPPRAGCICRCATPRPSPSACCTTRSTWVWSRGQVVDAELHVEPWVEGRTRGVLRAGACARRARSRERGRARRPAVDPARAWFRARARPSIARCGITRPGSCRGWNSSIPRPSSARVESGLGLGCLSRLALRDAFRRGSLVAVEVPGARPAPALPASSGIAGKYHGAALRRFVEVIAASSPPAPARSDEIPPPVV